MSNSIVSSRSLNDFVSFFAFRLRYTNKGRLTFSGFCEPADANADDMKQWNTHWPLSEPAMDVEQAKYVIDCVGDRFCELVEQESEAMTWAKIDVKIAWKRAVQGVREMCDVCETSLFNVHWVCHKCGFVACLDCFRREKKKRNRRYPSEGWLTCFADGRSHEPQKLVITQIIPRDALSQMGRMMHEIRDKWGIEANCSCTMNTGINAIFKKSIPLSQVNDNEKETKPALLDGIDDNHSSKEPETPSATWIPVTSRRPGLSSAGCSGSGCSSCRRTFAP